MDIVYDVWTLFIIMDIFNKFIKKNLHLLIGLAPINQVCLENLMFFLQIDVHGQSSTKRTRPL
jgi:hypothetical protein